MTEHLPECLVPDFDKGLWICVCNQLRACEARVTERWESLRGLGESYAYKTGSDNGFDAGLNAGLDAAREAVEVMDLHGCHPYRFPDCNCLGPQVIAAIDALRKEQK